ncbi:hypothetical protein [Oscillatoria sp. FACHB-1406]|uniref:hypothetical protein n=1 Tax=Oscillatoria sp. FACHB-1406 TaxID=2692846 RepID=UPI0016880B1E|nr:hypothetical protein [Oscillatoria sp. FACHB-1406]MBD2576361.1 hypothetical protein [Oscillatoria sp. FACHB-1406]
MPRKSALCTAQSGIAPSPWGARPKRTNRRETTGESTLQPAAPFSSRSILYHQFARESENR